MLHLVTFTFDAIVRETRHSAFSAHAPPQLKRDESANGRTGSFQRSRNFLDAFMRKSHYFWVALVVADTAVQASRTNDMSDAHADALRISALVFTVLFDVEILLRLASALPDWKAFFRSPRNRLDAFLALVTTILRIPPVTSSIAYPWSVPRSYAIYGPADVTVTQVERLRAYEILPCITGDTQDAPSARKSFKIPVQH